MAIFLLTPVDTKNREWACSDYKKAVQVEAEDEPQARYLAAKHYCPERPGVNVGLARPWMRTDLTTIQVLGQRRRGLPLVRKVPRNKPRGRIPMRTTTLNVRLRFFK